MAVQQEGSQPLMNVSESKQDMNQVATKLDDDRVIGSIQIISDVHLEFTGVFEKMEEEGRFPRGGSPILALLGDIGYPHKDHYWNFIDKVLDQFQYLILITGNHEYYQNEYSS